MFAENTKVHFWHVTPVLLDHAAHAGQLRAALAPVDGEGVDVLAIARRRRRRSQHRRLRLGGDLVLGQHARMVAVHAAVMMVEAGDRHGAVEADLHRRLPTPPQPILPLALPPLLDFAPARDRDRGAHAEHQCEEDDQDDDHVLRRQNQGALVSCGETTISVSGDVDGKQRVSNQRTKRDRSSGRNKRQWRWSGLDSEKMRRLMKMESGVAAQKGAVN